MPRIKLMEETAITTEFGSIVENRRKPPLGSGGRKLKNGASRLTDVNQLPVVRDGLLEGIISRGNILQFLYTRAELNI